MVFFFKWVHLPFLLTQECVEHELSLLRAGICSHSCISVLVQHVVHGRQPISAKWISPSAILNALLYATGTSHVNIVWTHFLNALNRLLNAKSVFCFLRYGQALDDNSSVRVIRVLSVLGIEKNPNIPMNSLEWLYSSIMRKWMLSQNLNIDITVLPMVLFIFSHFNHSPLPFFSFLNHPSFLKQSPLNMI